MKSIRPWVSGVTFYEITGTKTVPLSGNRTQTMLQASYIDKDGGQRSALLGESIALYVVTPENVLRVERLEEIQRTREQLEQEAQEIVASFVGKISIDKYHSLSEKVNKDD